MLNATFSQSFVGEYVSFRGSLSSGAQVPKRKNMSMGHLIEIQAAKERLVSEE